MRGRVRRARHGTGLCRARHIAERAEPVLRVGRNHARVRRGTTGVNRLGAGRHRAGHRRLRRGDVVLLSRIGAQVVDLGRGAGADRHPAPVGQRLQRAPAGHARILRLAVQVRLTPDRREQILSFHRLGRRDARGVEQRWRQIREAGRLVARRGRLAGRGDDQRHPQRRVVEQHAVRALAMVAQSFAVIAGNDDDGTSHQPARAERVEQARELRVGVCDLAVVRRRGPRAELGRRIVRGVGIVEVDPQKKWLMADGRWLAAEPGERAVDDRRRRSLGFEAIGRVGIARDLIVVGVEPLRQAEAAIEHERADKRRGLVAGVLQSPRDRLVRLGQRVDPVFADAVRRRQQPGVNRRVRRQGQRHGAAHRGEPDAGRGEPIDRRRDTGTDAVRPERVDGHQQQVRRHLRRSGRLAAARHHHGQWLKADGYGQRPRHLPSGISHQP